MTCREFSARMADSMEQCDASQGNLLSILAAAVILWMSSVLLVAQLLRHFVGYFRKGTRARVSAVLMPAMGTVVRAIVGTHDVVLPHIPVERLQHGAHLIVPKVNVFQNKTVMYFHHGIYDSTRKLMIAFTHEKKGVAPDLRTADTLGPRDETDFNWTQNPVLRMRRLSLMVASAAMKMFLDSKRNKVVHEKLENFIVEGKYVIPYQDHLLHVHSEADPRVRRSPEEAVELARVFAELGDGRAFGPYEFTEWNCESFVNCVYTLESDITAEALRRRYRNLPAGKEEWKAFSRQWLRAKSHAVTRQAEHVMMCGLGVFFMNLSYKLEGEEK